MDGWSRFASKRMISGYVTNARVQLSRLCQRDRATFLITSWPYRSPRAKFSCEYAKHGSRDLLILVKKLHPDYLTEREVTLPTHHKAQLTETAMPWVAVWSFMREGILPVARQILAMLDFYVRKDHKPPNADMPLTPEEEEELTPIISALTIAAVQSEQMRTNVLAATLARVAREPGLSDLLELPAAVQWELASQNRRQDEAPGTYAMDIWGTDQTGVPYVFGPPPAENLSRAAELALHQVQARRSAGRLPHTAHRELAERLGPIFTASGVPISRSRSEIVRREHREKVLRSMEGGPFCDFLALVLPPFQRFCRSAASRQ